MTTVSRRIIRLRLLKERPTCSYCGRNLRRKTATLDHLLPLSKGGTDTDDNAVLCCNVCNQAKDNRSIIEWIADLLTAASESGVIA